MDGTGLAIAVAYNSTVWCGILCTCIWYCKVWNIIWYVQYTNTVQYLG